MSRAALNPDIEGTTLSSMVKAKGRGRRKPTLLPVGEVFGRLTATEFFEFRTRPSDGRNRTYQKFVCDCGNVVWALAYNVKGGNTQSCGCYHSEIAGDRDHKDGPTRSGRSNHGESGTPLYKRWIAVMGRCYTTSAKAYKFYGGRGIQVDPEWHDFLTFKAWAIETGFEKSLELDRIDPDGNYGPNNCRWVTKRENVKRAGRAFDIDIDVMLRAECIARGITTESRIIEIVTEYYTSQAAEEVMQPNVR